MKEQPIVPAGVAPVPVIDISPFFSGSEEERQDVARSLNEACEGVGFMMITGHGVEQGLIDEFFAVSKEFFALPLDEKLKVMSPTRNRFQGYAAPGTEEGYQVTERQSFIVCRYDSVEEAVAAGCPADTAGITIFPALWPEHPARLRAVWRQYFEAMEDLAHRLLAVFEVALGLPGGWFFDKVDKDQSTLAANYYSNDIESGRDPTPYRFKAHVDGTVITILYQDDGPGSLQLHQRGTAWRDVSPVEGAFVVNLGSLMARWTNDRYVATPHRVLKPTEQTDVPRMSAPFFLKPNHEAIIEPIPELIEEGDNAHYEPVDGFTWIRKSHTDEYDSTARFAEVAAKDPILR